MSRCYIIDPTTMTIKAEYIETNDLTTLMSLEVPIVVDFTATWCGPCKVVGPLMDQLAQNYEGRAKVVKIDLDTNKAIAKQFTIKSIPAVIYLKNGEEVERIIGVKTYEYFQNALEKLV